MPLATAAPTRLAAESFPCTAADAVTAVGYRHNPGITIRRPDEHDRADPPTRPFGMRQQE